MTYINVYPLFKHIMRRRCFVGHILALTLGCTPFVRLATASRRDEDFAAGAFQATWQALTGNQTVIDTQQISLNLPKIAENGAVVPITIRSELADLGKLYLLIENNPTPLAAAFELSPVVEVHLTARIKMAESCNVYVLARQGEHWLRCRQWVQVMVGGCGTG